MKQAHQITCHQCGGAGKIPLPDHLSQALAAIKTKPMHAREVLALVTDDVSVNSINNRLSALYGLGLATRTRKGKLWMYRAA